MDPRHFWRFWSPLGDKTYSKLNHLVLGSYVNRIEVVIVVIHLWVKTRTLDPFVGLAQTRVQGGANTPKVANRGGGPLPVAKISQN